MENFPEQQAAQALLAAEVAYRKARPSRWRAGSARLYLVAAELIEAVRLATADFDPRCRPDFEYYIEELREAARSLRVAATGRGFGEKSKRYVAVERLLNLADRVIKGEVKPEGGWAKAQQTLTPQQKAALALADTFPDVLPHLPFSLRRRRRGFQRQKVFYFQRREFLRPLTDTRLRKLLATVAKGKTPLDKFGVFRAVARAFGFTKDEANNLTKFTKRDQLKLTKRSGRRRPKR